MWVAPATIGLIGLVSLWTPFLNEVYRERWGAQDLVNEDIFEVLQEPALMASLDALCPDVLVGGFPCQDYSVAKPLSHSQGLQGDKGVMWWAVSRMLHARRKAGAPLKYLVLENVDRLLSSPATCPGQDFARILVSLQQEGYAVEWRVVNAADYGFAQKRRRLFMVAAHESTPLYTRMAACAGDAQQGSLPWLLSAAAGCMVCVTAQEMIPQAVEGDEPVGVVSIVLGFALMMALDVAL